MIQNTIYIEPSWLALWLPEDSYYSYEYVCVGSSMSWDYAGSLFS
jgi:hypothetical protein